MPGSSPSDADEMHYGRKGRREGDSCGEFQTVLLELRALPHSLTLSEARAFLKQPASPSELKFKSLPHILLGYLVTKALPHWPHYLGSLPAWQSMDKEPKNDVGWEASFQFCILHFLLAIKKNHDNLQIYINPLYATCKVNLSQFISNYTLRHQELCEFANLYSLLTIRIYSTLM